MYAAVIEKGRKGDLEHTVSELQKDYDLMTEAFEEVSSQLYV